MLMGIISLLIFSYFIAYVMAYTNHHFTISKQDDDEGQPFTCNLYHRSGYRPHRLKQDRYPNQPARTTPSQKGTVEIDPYLIFQANINNVMYGNSSSDASQTRVHKHIINVTIKEVKYSEDEKVPLSLEKNGGLKKFLHQPSGELFRGELVRNKSGVHLPMLEFLHRGFCKLEETKDYMQTAVNAFAILLYGNLKDVERLSAEYVLRSARTISMMKIPREKLAATWNVIKDGRKEIDIPYETLARYRPLFKYLSGKEIARLNLSDSKILSYIGTHADLDRHQVGLVASQYLSLNERWTEPRYLNLMNNLLCGVPMTFMRRIPDNTYLQLSLQVFYHIRACDPLQRRFYLALMTRTQVLGKSYSWTANDISRLGLLLAEVSGPSLSFINPKAMAGITSQVMLAMAPENLQHLTEAQLKYIGQKPLNILARKLKEYQDQLQIYGDRGILLSVGFTIYIPIISYFIR